jgi:hypothetical protein
VCGYPSIRIGPVPDIFVLGFVAWEYAVSKFMNSFELSEGNSLRLMLIACESQILDPSSGVERAIG